MSPHHFISYSTSDGEEFSLRLHDELLGGPPSVPVWHDKRSLHPGRDWDSQVVDALRTCDSVLFVMTRDSVDDESVCKDEWTKALAYKKAITPLLVDSGIEAPFLLQSRQHIDFTGEFEPALARLRLHLERLASPAGRLETLKHRRVDAQRDLSRTRDPARRARIQAELTQFDADIAEAERVRQDPQSAAQNAQQRIERHLDGEKQARPTEGPRTRFINPPPTVAPSWFQDRFVETRQIADFLKDPAMRMITVTGRGGVGKTAMVCRLLHSLERGQLPDDGGPFLVDGIVYLSANGSRRISVPNLLADVVRLQSPEAAAALDALQKNPHATAAARMQTLLTHVPEGCTVVLLDNFEDLVDPTTRELRDSELDEALRALLTLPQHGLKVILTTRIAPRALALVQPGRQLPLPLDDGIPSPFAEKILQSMDPTGTLGLRDAPMALLTEARERTRGYPRALEALCAILAVDRDTTLADILADTAKLLPDHVVRELVGEAFSRLDPSAQEVMQALAIYGRPVPAVAVDFLLQPYRPEINARPVIGRLVGMQFVRKEADRYYLHPTDRAYALGRVPRGERPDGAAVPPPFTQIALLTRGAAYFEQARTDPAGWETLDDLVPILAECDLRQAAGDGDGAMRLLLAIDLAYLERWGHYALMAELHERLRGHLDDPLHRELNIGRLGIACERLGQFRRALALYAEALESARGRGDKQAERSCLGELGGAYAHTGQTLKAIACHEQTLRIAQTLGDTDIGYTLLNLSICHGYLGNWAQAREYQKEILRQTPDRLFIGYVFINMALGSMDEGRDEEAIELARACVQVGEQERSRRLLCTGHAFLALAQLYAGDLASARTAAEAARLHDEPEFNYYVLAYLGVIALRQGDTREAIEAFDAARLETGAMIGFSSDNFRAYDMQGLTLCGLTLCGAGNHIQAAADAYAKARAISGDAGIIGRALRTFDALGAADPSGRLAPARAALLGGNAVPPEKT